MQERKDLQRLLHEDISPIGDDLLVIEEEYGGDWEDSSRRIDLLCLSKNRDLVVVEIKRTEDGGHMELQAIRYAAMVSVMTLDQVVQAFARAKGHELDKARSAVIEFLQLGSEDEQELSGEVRIVLASADFSTEITTAVLWLNRYNVDITCIRLRPYRIGDEILIDVTKIIPLPETAEYTLKMRTRNEEKRESGSRSEIHRKFWSQLIGRSKSKTQLFANRSTTPDYYLSAGLGRRGFSLVAVIVGQKHRVQCEIRLPGGQEKSTAAFNALRTRKDEIESRFGASLDWRDMPNAQSCMIQAEYPGGLKSPESDWLAIQDSMINALVLLEAALKIPIQELGL